jgi:hypothetical protein
MEFLSYGGKPEKYWCCLVSVITPLNLKMGMKKATYTRFIRVFCCRLILFVV